MCLPSCLHISIRHLFFNLGFFSFLHSLFPAFFLSSCGVRDILKNLKKYISNSINIPHKKRIKIEKKKEKKRRKKEKKEKRKWRNPHVNKVTPSSLKHFFTLFYTLLHSFIITRNEFLLAFSHAFLRFLGPRI